MQLHLLTISKVHTSSSVCCSLHSKRLRRNLAFLVSFLGFACTRYGGAVGTFSSSSPTVQTTQRHHHLTSPTTPPSAFFQVPKRSRYSTEPCRQRRDILVQEQSFEKGIMSASLQSAKQESPSGERNKEVIWGVLESCLPTPVSYTHLTLPTTPYV